MFADLYLWVLENRALIKIFYGLAIVLICFIIVLRTNKLFRISLHQGIRYFRNAFFFFGIAFIVRYLVGGVVYYGYFNLNYNVLKNTFEFFIIMAGFFLIYSLLWKKFEHPIKHPPSSLFNLRIFVFYAMTIIIVFLDSIWATYQLMFISQIILFIFATAISYVNYRKTSNKHKFPKLYFVAMVFSLSAWILNAVASLLLNWNLGVMFDIYIINMIIFLLFLYGVINVTRRK